jgi:hypothetical protein
MKKMMMALMMMVTVGTSVALAGDEKVSPRVLKAFNSEFAAAREVSWTAGADFYQAAFSLNGQRVFAFYTTGGDLISTARYISSLQLPLHLFKELKNDFSDFWVSDLFEVNNSEGTHYYVKLESAEARLMLKSTNGGDWNFYDKKRKV